MEIGNTEYATHICEKLQRKLFPVFEQKFARGTIQKISIFCEGLRNVVCRCGKNNCGFGYLYKNIRCYL